MKKITLLVFLLVCSIGQAQTYCEISDDYEGIEEITSVNFGSTSINNTDTSSIYVNFTSTVANATLNQSYSLVVKGNSDGAFDNEYVAYIDWNHNGVLNDAGEMYYIGLIHDSDGYDTQSATINITVPNDAVEGTTRIRIVNVWTDASDDYILNPDPCYVSIEDLYFGDSDDFYGSYGQAIDFTLNVASLGIDTIDGKTLSVYPNPVKDVLNVNYKSDITEAIIYNLLGQEVLSQTINSSDFQLNLKGLLRGTYVMKLFTPQGQQTLKIVKE